MSLFSSNDLNMIQHCPLKGDENVIPGGEMTFFGMISSLREDKTPENMLNSRTLHRWFSLLPGFLEMAFWGEPLIVSVWSDQSLLGEF